MKEGKKKKEGKKIKESKKDRKRKKERMISGASERASERTLQFALISE